MRGALRYEWKRITTVRSTYWFSAMALGLSGLIAFFIAYGFSSSDLSSDSVSNFVQASTLVVTAGGSFGFVPVLSAPFCAVLGAMAFGHEYRYGTIKQTLTAVPDRVSVFFSKLIMLVIWLVALMVVIVFVNMAFGAIFLDKFSLGGSTIRPIIDFVLYNVAFGLAGFGWAAILRNLAGALVAVLVYPFVLEPIAFNVFRLVHVGGFNQATNFMPAAAGRRTIFSPYEIFANPLTNTGADALRVWDVAASTLVFWGGMSLMLVVALTLFLRRDA